MADASQNGELQEVIRNGMDVWRNDVKDLIKHKYCDSINCIISA